LNYYNHQYRPPTTSESIKNLQTAVDFPTPRQSSTVGTQLPEGTGNLQFATMSKTASGAQTTSYPVSKWSSLPGVKRPARETDTFF